MGAVALVGRDDSDAESSAPAEAGSSAGGGPAAAADGPETAADGRAPAVVDPDDRPSVTVLSRRSKQLSTLAENVGQWRQAAEVWSQDVGKALGHLWRRSLQLRVIVSTLTLSLIVISILGVVLTNQLTNRLAEAKLSAAIEEMERARGTVQSQLAGVHDTITQGQRLSDARDALSARGGSGHSSGAAGSFDSALSLVGGSPHQQLSAGPIQEVPDELRRFVARNQVAYQFATVDDVDGYRGQALIIGSPSAEVPSLEIYLIFPLASEQRSLALMRGTMVVAGLALLILLAAIAALVTRQVVLPIRSAARIAGRFADGRLKERMLVRGEDDMAKLAEAFNEMAESLSEQITQLEEFGSLQRRFTSDVSHELRTPLTTVRMAADLIHGSSDDLDVPLARSAELLVTELDRFEGLLNDLLEISRHDAGVAELQVESLDVRMCARAALMTVRRLALDAQVEIDIDLPEEPLVAEVDPRRVERVLRNLLANAIDHGEGKPVLIRMRGDRHTNCLAVVVRDQGVGLRAGEEKMVFSRFWRSDPSRMRRSGGTGLGLSISVEDASLHDGKLEAWGQPGAGASFRLTIPIVRGEKMGRSPLPLEIAVRSAKNKSERDLAGWVPPVLPESSNSENADSGIETAVAEIRAGARPASAEPAVHTDSDAENSPGAEPDTDTGPSPSDSHRSETLGASTYSALGAQAEEDESKSRLGFDVVHVEPELPLRVDGLLTDGETPRTSHTASSTGPRGSVSASSRPGTFGAAGMDATS